MEERPWLYQTPMDILIKAQLILEINLDNHYYWSGFNFRTEEENRKIGQHEKTRKRELSRKIRSIKRSQEGDKIVIRIELNGWSWLTQ
jgi:hypothetical protein